MIELEYSFGTFGVENKLLDRILGLLVQDIIGRAGTGENKDEFRSHEMPTL